MQAGMIRAWILGMIVVQAFTSKAQDGWHRIVIDPSVSVEVPDKARENTVKNVKYYAREDSCIFIAQATITDAELPVNDIQKSIMDQYLGSGFVLLDEKIFTLNGKKGVELKFQDDANNLDIVKSINYIKAFSLGKRLYTFTFGINLRLDQAMSARKDRFFDSVKINIPQGKQQTKPADEINSATENKKNWVMYVSAIPLFLLLVILFVRSRKKKQNPE